MQKKKNRIVLLVGSRRQVSLLVWVQTKASLRGDISNTRTWVAKPSRNEPPGLDPGTVCHDGHPVQRGLPVEQHHIAVREMTLHNVAKLEVCGCQGAVTKLEQPALALLELNGLSSRPKLRACSMQVPFTTLTADKYSCTGPHSTGTKGTAQGLRRSSSKRNSTRTSLADTHTPICLLSVPGCECYLTAMQRQFTPRAHKHAPGATVSMCKYWGHNVLALPTVKCIVDAQPLGMLSSSTRHDQLSRPPPSLPLNLHHLSLSTMRWAVAVIAHSHVRSAPCCLPLRTH